MPLSAWERPKPGDKNAKAPDDPATRKWSVIKLVERTMLAWTSRGTADRNRIPVTDSTGKIDASFLPATVVLDSEYVAADVLTKVKTVDGTGSGLDADLLDGVDSTAFARTDISETFDANVQVTGLLKSDKITAVTGVSLGDDVTSTLTTAGRGLIYVVRASGNQHFLGFFSSSGVVEVSDPAATWVQADTDGSNCLYWSSGLVLKNRTGSTQTYYYHIFGDPGVV